MSDSDSSSNCPYQISLARYKKQVDAYAQEYVSQGCSPKTAQQMAEARAEKTVRIWHCRDCAKTQTGCCSAGEIRFQEVGGRNFVESILNYKPIKQK